MHRFVHLLSGNLCRFPIIRGGQLFSEASMPKRVGYFNRGNYVSIISALAIEELFVLGMGTAWNSNWTYGKMVHDFDVDQAIRDLLAARILSVHQVITSTMDES